MNEEKALLFIEQYAAGIVQQPEEQARFREWLLSQPDEKIASLLEQYVILLQAHGVVEQVPAEWAGRLWERIDALEHKKAAEVVAMPQRSNARWYRYVAAAVLFLAMAAAYLLYRPVPQSAGKAIAGKKYTNDVLPGTAKATLTLGDGTIVLLDEHLKGAVAQQDRVKIFKPDSGQLVYRFQNQGMGSAGVVKPAYNTLATPKGGQYQLLLPDGSKVWLNAASSLRFPTAFTGNERRVELTGEAYFEVADVAAAPFIVQVNHFDVAVLGTHFNINAYQDEPYHAVTLLEGSVKVNSKGISKILLPGQQAAVSEKGIKVTAADVEEAVAWKNGLFQFTNANLEQVMRQLERWYNIQVNYANIPDKHFYGIVSRQFNLSKVLDMLEVTGGVAFRIDGNRLEVLDKK